MSIVSVVLIAAVMLFASGAFAQTCSLSTQVKANGYNVYNSQCTNLTQPFCTNAQKCSQCNPALIGTQYDMCNCPPNQYCDGDSSHATYGTCVSFNIGNTLCLTAADCSYSYMNSMGQYIPYIYFSCISGKCAPCNNTYFSSMITCPGGSPYPLSSHPGETRTCGADGYWVGGGQLTTGTAAPTTTQSSASPGPSQSPSPSPTLSTGSKLSATSLMATAGLVLAVLIV